MNTLFQSGELPGSGRKGRAIGISLGVFVVLCGTFAIYQVYDRHHLSSDLKRILTVATDEHATEADLISYLHEARVQVRTKKDAAVLGKFEKAVQLANDSREVNNRILNEQLSFIRDPSAGYEEFNSLIELRSQSWNAHRPVPKDLQSRIEKALADSKARQKQDDELQTPK